MSLSLFPSRFSAERKCCDLHERRKSKASAPSFCKSASDWDWQDTKRQHATTCGSNFVVVDKLDDDEIDPMAVWSLLVVVDCGSTSRKPGKQRLRASQGNYYPRSSTIELTFLFLVLLHRSAGILKRLLSPQSERTCCRTLLASFIHYIHTFILASSNIHLIDSPLWWWSKRLIKTVRLEDISFGFLEALSLSELRTYFVLSRPTPTSTDLHGH
jgi:hypothetical protein